MAVEILRSLSELSDVAAPWAALADDAGARHNMQPFWCLPWWRHLGQGELHVVAVESGGQLAALAPLYRQRRYGVDILRFLGSEILGVGEVLVAPGHDAAGEELWTFLFDQPRCVVDLHQHRLAGPGVAALRRLEPQRWRARLGPSSPFVTIDGPWDDYWANRRRSFRRELDRKQRSAERAGIRVRVEVALDPDEVDKLLPQMTEVFDIAERGRPMLHFLAGSYRPFTTGMLRRAAEQSRLALFVLYFGDRPVATSFTFRSRSLIGGGGLRFDPAFGRYSPGQILFRHILEHAFAVGCIEFDFAPLDVPYKREWSTGTYDTVEISAFSSNTVHVLHIAESMIRSSRLQRKG